MGEHHSRDLILDPGTWIRGRLLDETGKPLRNWFIRTSGRHDAFEGARTRADGEFYATNLQGDPPFMVHAAPTLGESPHFWKQCAEGDVGDLSLRSEQKPTARVLGKVLTMAGIPPRAAHIRIAMQPNQFAREVDVDPESGRFEFESCTPGKAKLFLYSGTQWLPIRSMDLQRDEVLDIGNVTVPATGSLAVSFVRSDKTKGRLMMGVRLVELATKTDVPLIPTGPTPKATLRPGEYELTVFGPNVVQQKVRFEIEAGKLHEQRVSLAAGTPITVVFAYESEVRWIHTDVLDAADKVCFAATNRAPFRPLKFGLDPGKYTLRSTDSSGKRYDTKIVVGTEPRAFELKSDRGM